MANKREAPVLQKGAEARKPQYKDNQNLTLYQKALSDLQNHLVTSLSASLRNLGQFDKNINRDLEGRLCREVCESILNHRSNNGFPLALYEDGDILRLYNGNHFSPIEADALQCIISLVLEGLGVGNAYIVRSNKIVADFALSRMRNNEACKYVPDDSLIAFSNGILNIRSDELLPPSPDLVARHIIALPYKNEECPLWQKTLQEDLEPELIPIVQETLGYVIAGPPLEKIAIFLGEGRNGKSLILNTFIHLLGDGNVSNFSISQITEKDGQKIPPMRNKIANICTDSGSFIGKGDEGTLKAYASGEPLMAKPLYKQPYLTRNYPRSIIAMNVLPATSDINDGYFRRFIIIPFTKQVPEEKVDIDLEKKLKQEAVGIMYWIIEGAKRVCTQGRFSDCKMIHQAQIDYRMEADPVSQFVEEKGYIASEDLHMKIKDVYPRFKEWLIGNGYKVMTQRTFSKRLKALKIKVSKHSGDMCAFMGNPFEDETPF